jgi:uncharacterized protein YndB with AHSA1/START domain
MSEKDVKSLEQSWSIERETVLSRVFDAPRELVFRAWTEKEHLPRWFGPKGFTCTTHEIDIREGGRWRFDMRGPDGTVWPNRMVFLQVKYPERLVIEHGADKDEGEDPQLFHVIVTFDAQGKDKTVVTMRQLHSTRERRDAVIGFGAVELGYQTLDKLAQHLTSLR